MRWATKTLKFGDMKTERKFLYFPLTLNEISKWLEYAEIVYVYRYPDLNSHLVNRPSWIASHWKEVYDERQNKYHLYLKSKGLNIDATPHDIVEAVVKK